MKPYICNYCGWEFPKQHGYCPKCGENCNIIRVAYIDYEQNAKVIKNLWLRTFLLDHFPGMCRFLEGIQYSAWNPGYGFRNREHFKPIDKHNIHNLLLPKNKS